MGSKTPQIILHNYIKIMDQNTKTSTVSQPTLFRVSEAGSRVRLPKDENARSRHQRLFVENVGKTEGNWSWRIFQIRELYLRLRKVLAPLTFVPKDNSLRLGLCEIMYLNLLFLFYFWGQQKRGSSSNVPSIEEEIRPT